ncbi:putative Late nodulin [Medicago truncatula]|uniref:Putative Late nodulin n=1 Tax=Medicago truncatula TaxID=3880 RepID=A0A396IUS5_MEDTR|nr:putative Late nodulin [Medicago truncatula]
MTEIVKFVYAMIIFFKLFLVATNNDDDSCYNDYHCINKSWLCPSGLVVRCITRQCKCITILNPIDFVST